jgi:hypothetical protein
MPVIIEGLLTTQNPDGSVNVAPMGPIIEGDFERLLFRPFPGSATYANLPRTRCGVFHLIDDVLLLVQTALNLPHDVPPTEPARTIEGAVLLECCRWYELQIEAIDESGERPLMSAKPIHAGRRRDGWGFNRARHAVIEATIAVTRLHLLPRSEITAELDRCRIRVEKTGGEREAEACRLLHEFVAANSAAGGFVSPGSL